MNRTLILAVLVTTGLMVCVTAASASPAAESGGCVEPVPQRSYESDRLVYSMAVDYSRCDWWPGDQIILEASLSRLDGQGEAISNGIALCGHPMAESPVSEEAPDTGREASVAEAAVDPDVEGATRSGTCDVVAHLEHPQVEAALYRGQITYPWDGAQRTVGFTALCGPAGGCVDLPVDPSPALGVGSDLYEQLVGGDGDAH